jgi:hypothetical protein
MFTTNQAGKRGRVRLNALRFATVLTWLLGLPTVGLAQGVYEVVAAFARGEHGLHPLAALIQGSDGSF